MRRYCAGKCQLLTRGYFKEIIKFETFAANDSDKK